MSKTRSWGGETVSLNSIIGLLRNEKFDGSAMLPNSPYVQFIGRSGVAEPHNPTENCADGLFRNRADILLKTTTSLSIAYTGPTYVTYKDWESADRANRINRLDLPQYRQDPVVTGNALLYFSQSYQYDPAGNRIQMTHKEHKDTFNFTYEYDKLNALIAYSAAINGQDPIAQRYTYDPQGNRTSLSQPGVKMSIAYHAQNNTPESLWFGQSKSDGNFAEFSHDKNGNRLSKMVKSNANDVLGQASYTWDARNRMLNYTLNDTIQTTSRYQFSGPRYEKKDSDSGKTVTTKYYVDAGHRLLSEKVIGDSGIKEYSYIYLGNQKLARISQNDASKKDEITYYLTDALGSATMTTYQHTASPNTPILVSQSLLDPWGNSVRNGKFQQTTQQDFTGKVMDERSGLYDFGFRFYDPLTAAWIGKDLVPADHNAPLSLNEYLYCLSNPLMFVDPDGRNPVLLYLAAVGNAPDTTVDMMMLSMSMQAFSTNPGLGTGAGVALDGIALVAPGVNSAMTHAGGQALGKAFNAADTFVGGRFKNITLKAGTVLERAYEIGKNRPIGQFMTRGRTAKAITSTDTAMDILALKGTSNLKPNRMAQLELLQDIPAQAGFIDGSSFKNGFQFHFEPNYLNDNFFKNIGEVDLK